MMQKIAKIGFTLSKPHYPLVPFLYLKGNIDREMTSKIDYYLGKMPRRSKKLALIVDSQGGQFSQALIIGQKLRIKAAESNVELITFGEQLVLNCGFLLLMMGDKVYIDDTTTIGGLETGTSKIICDKLNSFISPVTYSSSPSYFSEMKKNHEFDQGKAAEMKAIFEQFSQEAKGKIQKLKGKKLKKDVDLFSFYTGQQAVEQGLVDGIGRLYATIPQLVPKANIERLKANSLDNFKYNFKKFHSNSKW